MPSKTNQLPKGWKGNTARPPKRNARPLYLAGGALLVIIIGVVLLTTNLGRGSSRTGSPALVTGQPKLTLDREQINFGKVPLDKPVKAAFKLTNVGDQPLQILNQPVVEVKQGC
jgi:hypothetical protein